MDSSSVDISTKEKTSMRVNKAFRMLTSGILVSGFIILLLCVGGGGYSKTLGSIIGYGFVLTGVFLFVGRVMTKLVSIPNSDAKSVLNGLLTIGPFIVFMTLLICLIIMISYYFEEISENKISKGYTNLNNLSILNSVIVTYLFYSTIGDEKFQNTGKINQVSAMGMYFLEVFGFTVAISMYIVLEYFRTDGFTNLLVPTCSDSGSVKNDKTSKKVTWANPVSDVKEPTLYERMYHYFSRM